MKSLASYLRVIGFLVIAFLLLEFTIDSGDQMAIEKYPIIWGVLAMLLLFAIAVEMIAETLKSILYRGLSEEAQQKYLASEEKRKAQQFSGIKNLYKKLAGGKPIEQEGEIVLDHNYDGIRELDNKLPPWWLYMFYITIVFAGIYLVRYHIFDGNKQAKEFEIEMEEARIAVEEYKKNAKDLVDVNTVELLPAFIVCVRGVEPSLVPSTLKVTLAPASLPALVIATSWGVAKPEPFAVLDKVPFKSRISELFLPDATFDNPSYFKVPGKAVG